MNYSCIAKNLRLSYKDRKIVSVNGVHYDGKSNENVQRLKIFKQSCSYLPLDIGKHFPNLVSFEAHNTHLRHLVDGDLDGLTKLKRFDVSWNPIEKIGQDFFKGHETIEFISFYYCHLKVIDPQALDPLINLKTAFFRENVCISLEIDYNNDVQDLKSEIRDKCKSEYYAGKIFNEIEDDDDETLCEELSFTRRNVCLITSFFAIISIALLIVLTRIFTNKFRCNWSDLKEVLI